MTVTPLAAIADTVRGDLRVDAIETSQRRLNLLDTIDGRLAAKGWRLEVEPKDGSERWVLVNRKGRPLATAEFPTPAPVLADDLPDGPMRTALEPVIWIRALIPSASIWLTGHRTALRDDDGKVRCRLVAQTASIDGSDDYRASVRVEPLRGYRRDADRIADRISTHFGWSPDTPDPLAALARTLFSEPAAEPVVADPAEAAGPALRRVLLALLDTVEQRSRGVVLDIDSEELHELRVAIRRTRSILTLLRSPVPDRTLDRARETFARLGRLTGPTRDLDVHITAWRAHRRNASASTAEALAPLGEFLAAERTKVRAALVRMLRSQRLQDALMRWRKALADEAAWTRTEVLRRPIGELAGHRIRKQYRRAVREGTDVEPETPAEVLHTLRKRVKKLRYVIEIIRYSYPKKQTHPVLVPLRELQQILGDVQDTEVQADALRRYGQAMAAAGTAGPTTLMAIGAMAEDLELERAEARKRFAEVFAPIARRKFRDRLHVIAPKPKKGGTGEDG